MIKRFKERWADPWDPICYEIAIGLLIFKIVLIITVTIVAVIFDMPELLKNSSNW